jgi:hypothetical protein
MGIMRIKLTRFLLVFLASIWLGCGGSDLDIDFMSKDILHGTPDNTQAHMAVVSLSYADGRCSGTLISRAVVLTAAHCAYGQSPGSYTVGFGDNWYSPDHVRGVSEIWVHPRYDPDNLVHDIAMLRLSSEAPAGITPIPYLPESLSITDSDVGINLEFVGFGTTETGSAGKKLTANNQINWVCTNSGGCNFPAGWGSYNTICHDQNPGGICFGDSGGPAFVIRNDREYVGGIASYVLNEYCTGFACHGKVDEYQAEIRDFVGGILGAPCTAEWECDSGFCASGVCCESVCTDTCMACDLPSDPGRCQVAPNGTPCPDLDACNGTEVCLLEECVAGEPPDCDDDNPCTNETCNPQDGCVYEFVPDGTSCSNLDLCDGEETCQDGICAAGNTLNCDDNNLCTTDGCDPQTGCRYQNKPDGMDCGGGLCGPAACSGGECEYEDSLDCDDGDPCTADGCDPAVGCLSQPAPDGTPCTDNDLCNGDDTCKDGVCVAGQAPDCDDRSACTQDDCDPHTGCVHTNLPDGMACGGGTCGEASCSAGQCMQDGRMVCEDDNPCTWDFCDSELGCTNESMPDGSACGVCGNCTDSHCIQEPDCMLVEGSCGCGGNGTSGQDLAMFLIAFGLLAALMRKR